MEPGRCMSIMATCAAATILIVAASSGGGADRQSANESAVPDRDSLAAMVNYLSLDTASGEARSRFVFREQELAAVADTLAARLERYTGSAVQRQAFQIPHTFSSGRDTIFNAENLIARLPAADVSSGLFLLTAHFDAIANRSPGWSAYDTLSGLYGWQHMPAPGANDNASGVAALMEAARLLSGKEMPFDLEFVLFSGEELDRLGSIHYVEECDDECARNILGVINLDMIGYRGAGNRASCMSDYRSGWLADLLVTFAAGRDPAFPVTIIKPAPWNWDHASFWERYPERDPERIPAVTLAEPLGDFGAILYPHYHTIEDLVENVDIDLVQRIASIVTGFLVSFEGRPAEMSLLPSDVLLLASGVVRDKNVYQEGEELAALIRVRNTGGGEAPYGAKVRLNVFLDNAAGRSSMYHGWLEPPPPLRSSDVLVPLPTGAAQGGENRLSVRIDVDGMPDSPVDNAGEVRFVVLAARRLLSGLFFRPHPVRGRFEAATLCLNLAGDVDLLIEIFTLEGQRVAVAKLGSGYGLPLSSGLSCHLCGDIFENTAALAAGIYLYRVVVYAADGATEEHAGRFAVSS